MAPYRDGLQQGLPRGTQMQAAGLVDPLAVAGLQSLNVIEMFGDGARVAGRGGGIGGVALPCAAASAPSARIASPARPIARRLDRMRRDAPSAIAACTLIAFSITCECP